MAYLIILQIYFFESLSRIYLEKMVNEFFKTVKVLLIRILCEISMIVKFFLNRNHFISN